VDTIAPRVLRDLVREAIEQHIDWYQLHAVEMAEVSERCILLSIAHDYDWSGDDDGGEE
jgi:hypothetical protein